MSTQAPAAPNGTVVKFEPAAEAVVFRGVDLPLERIAVPDLVLGEGEALVAVELATVCGSDLHTVHGHRKVAVPLVLGHEQIGRITAIGPGEPPTTIDGSSLEIGDRIVWGVSVDCGTCRMCLSGMPQRCERLAKYGHQQMRRGWELSGSFATHVKLIPRTSIVRVREDLPAELLAPASCATATVAAVIAAAEETAPLDGRILVVTGCGMLGLTAVAMATELGAHVVAVDPDPARRELAWDFGADAVSGPGAEGVRAAIAVVARGIGRADAAGAEGFAVAFELSGANAAIQSLLEVADLGATIVLAGSVFTAPPLHVSAETIVRRRLTVRGVHDYRPEHLALAVAFLERADRAAFMRLVGEVVPFAEAEQAMTRPAVRGVRIGIRP
jgi:putative phosphonate catabolism associated alcohol dehydrogenase